MAEENEEQQSGGGAMQAAINSMEGLGFGGMEGTFGEVESGFNALGPLNPGKMAGQSLSFSKKAGMILVPAAGAAAVNVTANTLTSIKFFEGKGWSHEQAVGITSNLIAESHLNPQGPAGDGGKAVGVAQWWPERRAALLQAPQFAGVKMDLSNADLTTQLEMVNYELRYGGERAAGAALANTKTIEEASESFCQNFERPADKLTKSAERASIGLGVEKKIGASAVASTALVPATPRNDGREFLGRLKSDILVSFADKPEPKFTTRDDFVLSGAKPQQQPKLAQPVKQPGKSLDAIGNFFGGAGGLFAGDGFQMPPPSPAAASDKAKEDTVATGAVAKRMKVASSSFPSPFGMNGPSGGPTGGS